MSAGSTQTAQAAACGIEIARLASQTRQAYFTAVAAAETERYMRQVHQAAQAGAGLAREMARVGNVSRLRQMREQTFYADATLNVARAAHAAWIAAGGLTVPDLPAPPDEGWALVVDALFGIGLTGLLAARRRKS